MKGHFSVEWLSQSSQTSDNHQLAVPACRAASEVANNSSTSGTVPENLPGFYRQYRPVQDQPQEPVTENHIISTHHRQNQDNRANFQQCVQGEAFN